MITFETSEDFDNAVMRVLDERLKVIVYVHNQDKVKVEVLLVDESFSDSCISFDWDEE